jgi:peptidoglycan/LPS O-acetylase OafA/YrhL
MKTPEQPPSRGDGAVGGGEVDSGAPVVADGSAYAVRFPLFNSLRAIAALSLLIYHTTGPSGIVDNAAVSHFTSRLDVGVTLFFVISGFLLYRPMALARYRSARFPSVTAYGWRRLLRIVPAYWVVLTLTALVFHNQILWTWKGALSYYGFAHIYTYGPGGMPGFGQFWSLDIEMSFYIFLPMFALLLQLLSYRTPKGWVRSQLVTIGTVFAIAWLYKLVLVSHYGADSTFLGLGPRAVSGLPLNWLLTYADVFTVGMALAVGTIWWQEHESGLPTILRPLEKRPGIAWVIALAVFIFTGAFAGLPGGVAGIDGPHWLIRHALYPAIAVAVMLPAIIGDQTLGVTRRILGNRVFLWLGTISYGIFLYQYPLILWLAEHSVLPSSQVPQWSWIGWLVLVLGGTVALASASWYLLEERMMRLRHLVRGRPSVGGPLAGPGDSAGAPARDRSTTP